MKILEKTRNYSFWVLDFFKGSSVLKNLKEIKSINKSIDNSHIENYQNKKISELLEYSRKKVPFYKNMNNSNLDSFPIIDKLQYKENIDNFCSTEFDRSKLYKATTSGSTGTPFVSYQNKEKKNRNTADTIYFSGLAGYNLGESLFYLKIWSDNNRKSKNIQFLQNIYPIDVIQLSDSKIKQFINNLNSNKRKTHINGYSSALEEVCKYFDRNYDLSNNSTLKVGSILAQSEALTDETKEKLNRYFNCLPCSRYSNLEQGIIAQQTLDENKLFKINRASYKLEIFNLNDDNPANQGELGRIIITDLFNYAMPFIRYDTGDIGKFVLNDDGTVNYSYLEEIQGRKLDLLLDTKGNIVSSYIMYKNMFKYTEIDQYQLIQEDEKDYKFIISMKKKFGNEDQLKKEFIKYLGSDANFEILYIDEIPLLSSGKRRKIVNNYLKK